MAVFPRNVTSLDENVAVVDIATAQELFATPGAYGRILVTEQPEAREAARRAVGNVLPPGASIVTANERRTEIEGMLAGFRASLDMLGILALLVASVLTYDGITTSVVRRHDEIATLRALGATRAAIAAAFLCEGALLGALGGLVGVGAGTLLAQVAGVVSDAADVYAADRIAPLAAFGAGLVVAIVAAIAPARAADRKCDCDRKRGKADGEASSEGASSCSRGPRTATPPARSSTAVSPRAMRAAGMQNSSVSRASNRNLVPAAARSHRARRAPQAGRECTARLRG